MLKRLMVTLMLLAIGASALGQTTEDQGWPRVFQKDGKELTVFQPQVDSWSDYKTLHFRCAIAVKTAASKTEKYGVLENEAETVVDQDSRVVAVMPKIRELRFPNTSDSVAASLRSVVDELLPPVQAMTLSLDRILAYLDPEKQRQQRAVDLNLDPPKIFYSGKPAVLVIFLGEPQLQPVSKDEKTLLVALNTNWDVFYDTSSQKYFLLNHDNWLTASNPLSDPWVAAGDLPAGLSALPKDENWDDVRSRVPGKRDKNPPTVFVSTEPAELILTTGEPTFSPIRGTSLLRVSNTDSALFLNTVDGVYYLLVAGRWFRASSLDVPWTSASTSLPADFALIPDNDPAAYVKASVPGTTEARDAILLASVPSTTEVDTAGPINAEAAYVGQPNFTTIPGTTVQYASNSPHQVFFVDGGYYWCNQGTWLRGSTATGPWAFCGAVPAAIYTIPPSHPTHNVTYVTVQNTTPTTVVYTQTAGYSGEYVAATGVLMFGAGVLVGALIADTWDDDHHHYYPPYAVPYSYGCGARYSYGYGGYYRGASGYYGPYGGAGAGARYNPNTGSYSRGAYAYGPAGSATVRQAFNPYSGTRAGAARIDTEYGSAGRGAAYNPSTGTAVRAGYRSGDQGSVGGVQSNRGTGAVAWDTKNGQGAVVKGRGENVYAGKDGTVYKRDGSGEWSSNSGSGWDSVDKTRQPVAANVQYTATASGGRIQQGAAGSQVDQAKASGERAAAQNRQQQPSSSLDNASREATRNLESQALARQRGNQLSQRAGTERKSASANRSGSGGKRSAPRR